MDSRPSTFVISASRTNNNEQWGGTASPTSHIPGSLDWLQITDSSSQPVTCLVLFLTHRTHTAHTHHAFGTEGNSWSHRRHPKPDRGLGIGVLWCYPWDGILRGHRGVGQIAISAILNFYELLANCTFPQLRPKNEGSFQVVRRQCRVVVKAN